MMTSDQIWALALGSAIVLWVTLNGVASIVHAWHSSEDGSKKEDQ